VSKSSPEPLSNVLRIFSLVVELHSKSIVVIYWYNIEMIFNVRTISRVLSVAVYSYTKNNISYNRPAYQNMTFFHIPYIYLAEGRAELNL
jgi:hypothetical protein